LMPDSSQRDHNGGSSDSIDDTTTNADSTSSSDSNDSSHSPPVQAILMRCFSKPIPPIPGTETSGNKGAFERAKTLARTASKVGAELSGGKLTPAQEERYGSASISQLKEEEGESTRADLQERLQSILSRIRSHASRSGEITYEATLLKGKTLNAAMLPGGKMFLWEGLVEALDSDAALASIVAHEVAHSELRHLEATLALSNTGWQLGKILGKTGAKIGGVAGGGAGRFLAITYDQDQEYEADRLGLCLSHLAGYSADGGAAAIEKIEEVDSSKRKNSGGAPEKRKGAKRIAYDIVQSHPDPTERAAYLHDLAGRLKQ
jgi:predicted Zn-dependent protease